MAKFSSFCFFTEDSSPFPRLDSVEQGAKHGSPVYGSVARGPRELQALVYDVLPPSTAITDCAIGLSFFVLFYSCCF